MTYRVWAVDDLDNVLDVNVVLLRVQSQGRAVVLPAVDRLMAHRQHFAMHVQHLQRDGTAVTARNLSLSLSLSSKQTKVAHLESLSLQPDDDPHCLWVQLHQFPPLVLPAGVHARRRLRAQLQVSGQHFELQVARGGARLSKDVKHTVALHHHVTKNNIQSTIKKKKMGQRNFLKVLRK